MGSQRKGTAGKAAAEEEGQKQTRTERQCSIWRWNKEHCSLSRYNHWSRSTSRSWSFNILQIRHRLIWRSHRATNGIVAELGGNIPFDKLIGSKIICCLYILFEASQNAWHWQHRHCSNVKSQQMLWNGYDSYAHSYIHTTLWSGRDVIWQGNPHC